MLIILSHSIVELHLQLTWRSLKNSNSSEMKPQLIYIFQSLLVRMFLINGRIKSISSVDEEILSLICFQVWLVDAQIVIKNMKIISSWVFSVMIDNLCWRWCTSHYWWLLSEYLTSSGKKYTLRYIYEIFAFSLKRIKWLQIKCTFLVRKVLWFFIFMLIIW